MQGMRGEEEEKKMVHRISRIFQTSYWGGGGSAGYYQQRI